jgi:hypothetical protein
VYVRLKCSGEGLKAGLRAVAAVNIPCPHCGQVNQITFEPNGTVRTVAAYRGRAIPQPSYN